MVASAAGFSFKSSKEPYTPAVLVGGVDVSRVAHNLGIPYPVGISWQAWSDCVEWPDSDRESLETGRLMECLIMAAAAARNGRNDEIVHYTLYRAKYGDQSRMRRPCHLKIVPAWQQGDERSVTIMLASEEPSVPKNDTEESTMDSC